MLLRGEGGLAATGMELCWTKAASAKRGLNHDSIYHTYYFRGTTRGA